MYISNSSADQKGGDFYSVANLSAKPGDLIFEEFLLKEARMLTLSHSATLLLFLF